MAGKASRDRGKRGETEASAVLTERGFTVEDTCDGKGVCDLLVERQGRHYACEVKNCKSIDLPGFERQAREQGKKHKRPWILMARLEGYPHTFLVTSSDLPPTVWRGNGAKR